jgi:hypothetical protein
VAAMIDVPPLLLSPLNRSNSRPETVACHLPEKKVPYDCEDALGATVDVNPYSVAQILTPPRVTNEPAATSRGLF